MAQLLYMGEGFITLKLSPLGRMCNASFEQHIFSKYPMTFSSQFWLKLASGLGEEDENKKGLQ